MIVQHNMAALNANRMLGTAGGILSKSTEKLSSGYRINRAADDAAGLSISEKMRGQIRGLNRASSNAQDGITLIQTAEGALNETQNILQRMRELTVQAANETNTEDDRAEIQKEVNQLTSEINRIGNTTEYNTMKLLKGNTKDAVTSDMDVSTLQDSQVVEAQGSVSKTYVKQTSTLGKASTTTIQANSSKTTAAFKDPKLTVEGVKGQKSTTTFAGLTFTALDYGTGLNGSNITLKYDEDMAGDSTIVATANGTARDITITLNKADLDAIKATIGEDGSYDAATLMSKLNSITTAGTTLATLGIEIELPEGEDTANDLSTTIDLLSEGTERSSSMGAGVDAVAAQYKINMVDMAKEINDTITIAGTTLIMSDTTNAANGKVSINGSPMATTATTVYEDMITAFNDNNEKFSMSMYTTDGSTWEGTLAANFDPSKLVIVLTEKSATDNGETGKDEYEFQGKTSISDINVQAKGSGSDDILTIKDPNGQNLVQFKFVSAASSAAALTAELTGDKTTGTVEVTISLAGKKGDNTAELIQKAIRDLTTSDDFTASGGIDFRKFEVEASGKWDLDVGGSVEASTGVDSTNKFVNNWNSTSGGIETKKGEFTFDVTNSFAVGDEIVVGGKTFIAAKDADIKNGVFATGISTAEQASNILAALKASNLGDTYDMSVSGTKITLKEIKATGTNLEDPKVQDGASIKGEYSTKIDTLMTDGASFTIDGETISVSSKNAHVGYDDGTAMKAAETLSDQTKALAEAINNNTKLSEKYTASVGDDGSLTLTQKTASDVAPVITATDSTKGDFQMKLQIGANTGQSMTIELGDTRALALGVSGDGSVSTIKADNGSVATYVEIANVNSGSDNENVEYALDIGNHDKATNALSVLDDALSYISAQRSSLGAYQNRLEYTISNLDNTAENLQTAESNIRDVNMASEMVNYSKSSIIQQAAQSMLAQANQQTQGVLSLLR